MLLALVILCDSKFQSNYELCIKKEKKPILLSASIFLWWLLLPDFIQCPLSVAYEKWQIAPDVPSQAESQFVYFCHLPSYSSLTTLNTPTLINLSLHLPRPLIIFVASIWTLPIFALPESFQMKVFRSCSKLGCAIGSKCRDVICGIRFPCFGLSQHFASFIHSTAASVCWCVVRCLQLGALFHGPLSTSLSYIVLENKLKICSLFCWPHRAARKQLYAVYYLYCSNKRALFLLSPPHLIPLLSPIKKSENFPCFWHPRKTRLSSE